MAFKNTYFLFFNFSRHKLYMVLAQHMLPLSARVSASSNHTRPHSTSSTPSLITAFIIASQVLGLPHLSAISASYIHSSRFTIYLVKIKIILFLDYVSYVLYFYIKNIFFFFFLYNLYIY